MGWMEVWDTWLRHREVIVSSTVAQFSFIKNPAADSLRG